MTPKFAPLLFLVAIVLWVCPFATAATVAVVPADSAEIEIFLTSSFTPSPLPSRMRWLIQFGDDHVDIGDILSVRLYETSVLDSPILEIDYDGTFSQNGFFALFGVSDHFQDQQGLVVIELFEGTVDIERVFAETVIDGQRYLFSEDVNIRLVPEPSPMLLIGVTGFLFSSLRRRGT